MPPRSAKSFSRPRIQRIPSGSSPLAGSSRISTSGSPIRALAIPSRWRIPSEYWRTRFFAADLSSPTSPSRSSTRVSSTPIVWAEIASASRPRRPACWAEASSSTPTRRPGLGSRRYSPPSTAALPESGRANPQIILIVVVFPAPLGPRKPVTVPGSQRKETSSTTALPANLLVNFSASIMSPAFPLGSGAHIGLRSPSCPVIGRWSGPYFGSGSGPPLAPTLSTMASAQAKEGLEPARWQRSLLPGSMVDGPGADRSLRDWAVDALVTIVALGLGVASPARHLGTTRQRSRCVLDLVLGVASLAALWDRRRHPVGVAAFVIPAAAVSALAGGAGLVVLFNAAIRCDRRQLDLDRRRLGRLLARLRAALRDRAPPTSATTS